MKKKNVLSLILVSAMTSALIAGAAFAAPPEGGSDGAGGGESAGEQAPGAPGGGGESGGAGGPGGGAPGGGASSASEIVTLVPEEMDELIIGAEGYEFTTDVYVDKLEIDAAAEISSKYPVLVFFKESESVENGSVRGNVQFISDYDEKIAILHTNDVHGHIEVEPYVKGLADEMKDSGEYSLVLTVSAGDVYGGGEAVAGSYMGEFIPAIMDKVYDVIAPGNNDFGLTGAAKQDLFLSHLYDHAQTICANVAVKEEGLALADYAADYESSIGNELLDELYEKVSLNEDGSLNLDAMELENLEYGEDAYAPYTTFTTENGTVLGLFGLCTNGGALEVDLDPTGSAASSQASIDALRENGADIVLALGHTGWMGEGSTDASSNDTNSWQLANTLNGLDAFIDGHTHSIIGDGQGVLVGENNVLVNQAQSFGECIGLMILYVKDGSVIAVDGNVETDMEAITPDAQVQELVELATARVKEDYGKPIAQTEYFLNGERLSANNEGGSVRGNETNLGDLMTDIIRMAASEKMGVDYDFVCYPGYWLRSSIEAGDITLESLQGVFANPTVLYYDTYSAEQVLQMVEKGLSSVSPQKEDTTFNHYSGIQVTYINEEGSGTAQTITVGDTLIYDVAQGGILVDENWSAEGILTMTGGEIDNYTGDQANWVCFDKNEVQQLVGDWFQSHSADEYTIYPNTIAPDQRIVEIAE